MKIERSQLLHRLTEFSRGNGGLVIGRPGVGKSFLLQELETQLLSAKIPCVLLPIDKLGDGSNADLKRELELETDFVTWLSSVSKTGVEPGVLIFDSFDSARDEVTRKNFLALIRSCLASLSGQWSVVVTARTYDAKRSRDLMGLFGGESDLGGNRDISCRHFEIPSLDDSELEQAFSQQPTLRKVFNSGSEELRAILKVPFNLWLLDQVIQHGGGAADLSVLRSEAQLLQLYWKRRVCRVDDTDQRIVLLKRLTNVLVKRRNLSAPLSDVFDVTLQPAWKGLLSDEIVVRVGAGEGRAAFSHNILFDYAVSVLAIEDSSQGLIDFLGEDRIRPFFLRPSLNFFLIRIWYENRPLFWKIYWDILDVSDESISLFARLSPTAVIAGESNDIADLKPVLDAFDTGRSSAANAILRALQALTALGVHRDNVWIHFLDAVSHKVKREFAWELVKRVSDIQSRRLVPPDLPGTIGRRVLSWIWSNRSKDDPWLDTLGSGLTILLVMKTFGTNPKESAQVLQPVLDHVNDETFSIMYLYRLCSEIDHVWPTDPELCSSVYRLVFGRVEQSDKTTNLGSPIIVLSSSRRQDFRMCQYNLAKSYQKFLSGNLEHAIQAGLDVLNSYVVREHLAPYRRDGDVLEGKIKEIQFLNTTARYLPDSSCIWGSNQFGEDAIEISDHLFAKIKVVSEGEDRDCLEKILRIFSQHAIVAYLWSEILRVGSEVPAILADSLASLALSEPILFGVDAQYQLGKFLKAAAQHLSKEQLAAIEEKIISLPKTKDSEFARRDLIKLRDLLISCIPEELLQSTTAKRRLAAIKSSGKSIQNRPLVSFSSGWETVTDESMLRERGVDTEKRINRRFLTEFATAESFSSKWLNGRPPESEVEEILPVARQLQSQVEVNSGADEPVMRMAEHRLSSLISRMSKGLEGKASIAYSFCRDMALHFAINVSPVPRSEEADYDGGGYSPAPRIDAAEALCWLGRLEPDSDIVQAIERLASDPVPQVRMVLFSNLFRVLWSSGDMFWKVMYSACSTEKSKGVLWGLSRSIEVALKHDPARAAQLVGHLLDRAADDGGKADYARSTVAMLMWLTISKQDTWAIGRATQIVGVTAEAPTPVHVMVKEAVGYVSPRLIRDNRGEEFDRGLMWVRKILISVFAAIENLTASAANRWDEASTKRMRDLYSIADEVVTRIYFSAGTNAIRRDDDHAVSTEERRRYYECVKALLQEVIAQFAQTSGGILFASTAHHLMELMRSVLAFDPRGALTMASAVSKASEKHGYNIDSMAVAEVVAFVQELLADHRDILREDESLANTIALLDTFCRAGWPEAMSLVWRLDEAFR